MSWIDAVTAPLKAKFELIKWALIIGGLLALVVVAGIFWDEYKTTKIRLAAAETALVLTKAVNKELQVTIDKKMESGKIDEKTNLNVARELDLAAKTTDQITTAHVSRIREIEQKYSSLPKTEENQKAKMDEISADRLTRLWDVYCIANPEDAKCSHHGAGASMIASSAVKP